MKQPWYRQVLSYITDISIESTSSPYNEILDLYLVKGRYQLCAKNAIYSYADKYDNFLDAFHDISIKQREISNVLILGFGLGSIPYMIEKNFNQKYSYTGIEIDDEVIYLASKYVLDELGSDIQLVQADAFAFLQLDDTLYDLICMDIFEDDVIPEVFEDEYFLELLRDTLTDRGMVIYNRLYLNTEDKQKSDVFFSEKIKSVFPNASYFISGGNMMIYCKKS